MKTKRCLAFMIVLSILVTALPAAFAEEKCTCPDHSKCACTCKCGCEDRQHLWGEWIVTYWPTCTWYGEHYRICRLCNAIDREIMPMIPHNFSEWRVVLEMTDHSAAVYNRSCRVCGYTEEYSVDPEGTLRLGSSNKDVRPVQDLLVQQGYLESNYADGYYGMNTARAVEAFQRDAGLTADGVAWPQTRERLQHEFGEWKIVKEAGYETPGRKMRTCEKCGYTEIENIGILIKPGAYNDNVWKVQTALRKLGYPVSADGAYGRETEKAVAEFQKDNGFEADGIIWPGIWLMLIPEE